MFKDTMSYKQFVQNLLCVISCCNNLFSWNLFLHDFFSSLRPLCSSFLVQSRIVWNISLQWPMLQYKTVYLLSKWVIYPRDSQVPSSPLMRMWFQSLLLGPAVLNTYSKSLSCIRDWLIHRIQIQCLPVPLPLCHNAGNLHVTQEQLRLCRKVTHKKSSQLTARLPQCYFSLSLLNYHNPPPFRP